MTLAATLREEAAFLRNYASTCTEVYVLAELRLMIEECERLARELDNGDAQSCILKTPVQIEAWERPPP